MTGKKSSSDLGRSLVRRHNQLIQQSKEKGAAFRRQNRRVLQSVTDVSDIDAVLENDADDARIYSAADPSPSLLINMDERSVTDEERRNLQRQVEALHASSLQVPRRPPWNSRMTVEELDANEKQAFLAWRRNLARLEENEKLVLTPFEKNLDIWRQLWRVLERSDLLVMVVDARDPLFYRCPDLEEYAREINEHKKTLLLVNKADLLPISVRQKWAEYFHHHNILHLFWSAKAATATLEGKKLKYFEEENLTPESSESGLDTKIYGRDELLDRLQTEAELIAAYRRNSDKEVSGSNISNVGPVANSVVVGFVGYPNVGKSSTINALVGEKRTGVTSTPGKTKHFQTLRISDELILCDCPGLVFPSFSISRYEMIACGVLPIHRMTENRGAVQVVADRVPRHVLESIYNIILPKPKPYELQSRPPLASELLRAYCSSRGYVSSRGLPDETRAARQILMDYIDGKLPHFEMPPGVVDNDELIDHNETNGTEDLLSLGNDESEDSDLDAEEDQTSLNGIAVDVGSSSLSIVLEDLENFDLSGKMPAKSSAPQKKKNLAKSYKQHKKPQKKKDRTWRVGNDGGDGMPIVRVFQKPAVNLKSVVTPI